MNGVEEQENQRELTYRQLWDLFKEFALSLNENQYFQLDGLLWELSLDISTNHFMPEEK